MLEVLSAVDLSLGRVRPAVRVEDLDYHPRRLLEELVLDLLGHLGACVGRRGRRPVGGGGGGSGGGGSRLDVCRRGNLGLLLLLLLLGSFLGLLPVPGPFLLLLSLRLRPLLNLLLLPNDIAVGQTLPDLLEGHQVALLLFTAALQVERGKSVEELEEMLGFYLPV